MDADRATPERFAVLCPACGEEAEVTRRASETARVSCQSCGFLREQEEDPRMRYGMQRIYSGAVDPYFGLRLAADRSGPQDQ